MVMLLAVSGPSDTIDQISFSTDGNATDVGNLTVARGRLSGQSSATHGYSSGGGPGYDIIDKFPFSSSFTTATDVGNLTANRTHMAGQSSIVNGFGYVSGGAGPFKQSSKSFLFRLTITQQMLVI